MTLAGALAHPARSGQSQQAVVAEQPDDLGQLRLPTDQAAQLASSVGPFWFIRGYLSEGRHWLTATAERAGPAADQWKARALTEAALLAGFAEDYDAAQRYGEQGLALNRQVGNAEGIAFPWWFSARSQ
jgi:hypothetical protein